MSEIPADVVYRLRQAHSALSDALGDTDISYFETDEELRSEDPAQWAAKEIAEILGFEDALPFPSTSPDPRLAMASDELVANLRELALVALADVPAGDDGTFFQDSHDAGEKPPRATELSDLLCHFADEGKPRVWAWTTVGKFMAEASPKNILALCDRIEADSARLAMAREALEKLIYVMEGQSVAARKNCADELAFARATLKALEEGK